MNNKIIKLLIFALPLMVLSCSSEQTTPETNLQESEFEGLIAPSKPEVDPNINTEDPKYNDQLGGQLIKGQPTCLGENKNQLLYTGIGLYTDSAMISPFPVKKEINIIGSDIPAGQQKINFESINDEYINEQFANTDNNLSSIQNGYKSKGELRKTFEEELKTYPILQPKSNISFKETQDTKKKIHVLGDKLDNIYMYKRAEQERINTTCKYISNSAYFFLDDSIANKIPTSVLSDIATNFEKNKSVINKIFANNEDVDNNGKIIFIIAPFNVDGLKGFFAGPDKLDSPNSNKGDILYINSKLLEDDKTYKNNKIDVLSTLIHEYQHMTLFDYRHIKNKIMQQLKIDPWIDEGLSMLAEYYAGYGINHKLYLTELFKHSSEISLIRFDNKVENYGFSLLFFRYMQTRFKDDFIKRIYNSQKVGIDLINETAYPGTNITMQDIYRDFVIAMLVSGRGITNNPRYNVVQFNHSSNATTNDEKYWYRKNGFNLSEIIDEVYKSDFDSSFTNGLINNKNKSLSLTLDIYSFQLTRWTNRPLNIKHQIGTDQPLNKFINYYYVQ